MNQFVGHKKVT